MYYFSLNYEKLQFEIAHHQTHNFYVETYMFYKIKFYKKISSTPHACCKFNQHLLLSIPYQTSTNIKHH